MRLVLELPCQQGITTAVLSLKLTASREIIYS